MKKLFVFFAAVLMAGNMMAKTGDGIASVTTFSSLEDFNGLTFQLDGMVGPKMPFPFNNKPRVTLSDLDENFIYGIWSPNLGDSYTYDNGVFTFSSIHKYDGVTDPLPEVETQLYLIFTYITTDGDRSVFYTPALYIPASSLESFSVVIDEEGFHVTPSDLDMKWMWGFVKVSECADSAAIDAKVTTSIESVNQKQGANAYEYAFMTGYNTQVGIVHILYNETRVTSKLTEAGDYYIFALGIASNEGQIARNSHLAVVKFTYTPASNPVYTIFSWESPDGVPVGFGGTVAYENGDATNRYNYANGDYHSLCLNGKKANMDDETASANAGHISFLLDNDIVPGDTIFLTAYYNKGEDKQVSAFFKTWSGVEFSSDVVTADIARGAQPEEIKVIVPEGVEDNILYMTRDLTGTNMFITKMVIKGQRSTPVVTATAAVHQFSTLEDLENLTITLTESNLTMRENYDGWLICDAFYRMYAAWAPAFGAGSTYTLNDGVMTVDAFGPIADVTKDLPEEATDLFMVGQSIFEEMGKKRMTTPIRYVPADPTAVENVEAVIKAQKLIENGQMIIIREGKRYNAVGAEL